MDRTRKLTLSLFASTLLAAPLVGAGTASAEAGEADLVLAVYQGGTMETVELSCAPPEGGHGRATLACEQIAAVDGDLSRLAGSGEQMCTFVYDPVTVAAFGTYGDEPVRYIEQFPNRCVMQNATGAVFDI